MEEVAQNLSTILSESITAADVLRLAVDSDAQLSVNFLNYAYALDYFSKPDPLETLTTLANKLFDPANIEDAAPPAGENIGTLDYYSEIPPVSLEGKIIEVIGLYDLPMTRNLRIDIERRCQNIKADRHIVPGGNQSIILIKKDGEQPYVLQQQPFDGSLRNPDRLHSENYVSANSLPDNAIIVMRTEALLQFQKSLNDHLEDKVTDNDPPEKPLAPKRENTLLVIIAALCNHSKISYQDRGATKTIMEFTERIGAPVTDDTVRDVLKKIPGALEAREK